MSMYLILITNFILLDFAFLFPINFFEPDTLPYERLLDFYILQITYVLIQHILEVEHRNYFKKDYLYVLEIGICFGLALFEMVAPFFAGIAILIAIIFMIRHKKVIYFVYILMLSTFILDLTSVSSPDLNSYLLQGNLEPIFSAFFRSLFVYFFLFAEKSKKRKALLHEEDIKMVKEKRRYLFIFYLFCFLIFYIFYYAINYIAFIQMFFKNLFLLTQIIKYLLYFIILSIIVYGIYGDGKKIFQFHKKREQIIFLLYLMLIIGNLLFQYGFQDWDDLYTFFIIFCYAMYCNAQPLSEELVFTKEEVLLSESIADSSRETRISFAQPIHISYTPRNVWQSCLAFLQKNKQIHIRNGEQEITFGYFISPREYEDILVFLKEYATLRE